VKTLLTYDLALELYQKSRNLAWSRFEKDQFERAILSILLNLREGSAKPTSKDRRRFYYIALGSLREVQTLLELKNHDEQFRLADRVGACLYRLCHRT
jgi:four helix bundle protein